MSIQYLKIKRAKPKNIAASRQLQDDWDKLLASHSKPLEKGAKAKGSAKKVKPSKELKLQFSTPRIVDNSNVKIRSVAMTGAATKVAGMSPDMQEAHRRVASRVGISYNKGGLQYLSDDEMKEQRTGSHKRR